jgi:rubrerythrin
MIDSALQESLFTRRTVRRQKMEVRKYECKECNAKFVGGESCDSESEAEVKCPVCGANDVEKIVQPEGVLDNLRDMFRPT